MSKEDALENVLIEREPSCAESKRPPSKLNPLVQLDEQIGRDMERGDE